jgi:transitional endoplasmic reticulum ATPase
MTSIFTYSPQRAEALRKLYPQYSLVLSNDNKLNLLKFPGARPQPLSDSQVVKNVSFVPNDRRSDDGPGYLHNNVEYGAFKLSWDVS